MQKFLKTLAEKAGKQPDPNETRYAGLNIRLLANLIDMLILMLISAPFMLFKPSQVELPADTPPQIVETMQMHSAGQITDQQFTQTVIDSGYIQQSVLPKILFYSSVNLLVIGILFILCWRKWNASPGKILFGLKIVDEKTLAPPSIGQYIVRFLGYIISMMPLFFGFLMIALNKKKKGLHDIMAGTVVIYSRPFDIGWEEKKKKWRIYSMVILLIIGAIYFGNKL